MYSKCPSVDDLRTGLQQFSSRLSVDESNWWLNFITTEEEQCLSWERRSDEELQAAGKSSFSLKYLVYREVKNDMELMSDEATEKRITELERLMDKNNTFPEVRIVLLSTHFIYDLKANLQDQKMAKHSPNRPLQWFGLACI